MKPPSSNLGNLVHVTLKNIQSFDSGTFKHSRVENPLGETIKTFCRLIDCIDAEKSSFKH
jgi:hypothetical protein